MRAPAKYQRRAQPAQVLDKKFDAPIAGWISNRSLSSPRELGEAQGAAVLDNFFPTSTTAIQRRGKEIYATLGDGTKDVLSIFSYANGNNRRLFASNDEFIYDITSILSPINWSLADQNGDTLATNDGDTIGQDSTYTLDVFDHGGEYSVVQFATTGNVFLLGFDGVGPGFIYNGSDFYPVTPSGVIQLIYDAETAAFEVGEVVTGGTSGATGTVLKIAPGPNAGEVALTLAKGTGTFQDNETITGSEGGGGTVDGAPTNLVPGISFPDGVTSNDIAFVFVYKRRLWFVHKSELLVYYLDSVDAIGGTAEKLPLGGILPLGGSVLWGAAWSLSSGNAGGLSDQLVFCSSEGEVAVFQGLVPEDEGWTHVGTYRIGTPLGRFAHFRGGGDIAVATSIGLVPLSKAISLDVTALAPASVSYTIQDAWQEAVERRGMDGWKCMLWPERKMAIISPPSPLGTYNPMLFVANAETGAWCRFTNWDARAMTVFQGQLYFGGPNGAIFRANVSGTDNGEPYTSVYVPLFDDFQNPMALKVAKTGRGVARARSRLTYDLTFKTDFDMTIPAAPPASEMPGGSVWGVAVWGESYWDDDGSQLVTQDWKSLAGSGYACSVAYQITSGAIPPTDAEIIRLEVTYTVGAIGS